MKPRHISEDEFTAMTKKVQGGVVGTRQRTTALEIAGSNPAPAPFRFFIVYGEAMGKPRMTQRDKWKQRPVVLRYWAWCDLVRFGAGIIEPVTLTQPVKVTLRIFLACPASWSRTKRLAHHVHPHTDKPDLDNISKGIMDALFKNDSFVCKVYMEKYWTEVNPQVAVTIEEVWR